MVANKVLYRLPKQGKIFGVCAGLAEYFDVDVTIVRVVFVLLAFIAGSTVPVYIVLAIVLPISNEKTTNIAVDSKVEQLGEELVHGQQTKWARYALGLSLLAIGTWLLLGQFFPEIFTFKWEILWPVLLVISGVFIIFNKKN